MAPFIGYFSYYIIVLVLSFIRSESCLFSCNSFLLNGLPKANEAYFMFCVLFLIDLELLNYLYLLLRVLVFLGKGYLELLVLLTQL